jgi:predicted DNA-binding protein
MPKRPNSKLRLKKAQLSFYPEPEKYEALKQLSDKTRVPQQAYIREGLDMILEKYKWELRK